MTALLLVHDFPPMGGGIARLHGELTRRYPRGELIVSTPQDRDAAEVDAQFNGAVDRLPVGRRTTKTLPGLLLWSRRATTLVRQHRARFVYCGNVKPAGYPARWVYERTRVPYCLFLYGADLLSEQHKYHHSAFKRRSGRAILGGAAALVAISTWTRDLALTVLGGLGLDGHGQLLRIVHLGTDPDRFRPGIDATALRERFAFPDGGGRWLLTVARLESHKGVDTVIAALPAIVARAPDVRYAVAGSGPERERLERLADRAGVADRVKFLGEVREADLPALYNVASVYVGPRAAPSASAWRASGSRSSKRRRAGYRWWRATRGACRTRCGTGRRDFSCRPRTRRRCRKPCAACWAIPRSPGASAPPGGTRSSGTTTGIASSATCGQSKRSSPSFPPRPRPG